MHSVIYSSNPTKKSSKRKSKNPVSQLAVDSFEAFRPFINIFDPGAVDWEGSPVHTITKEDWRLFRRYKDGERGLIYQDGEEFRVGRDVVCNIYSPRHAHRHIQGAETTYYTSGRNGFALLYLDIDAHQPWQTDEYKAKAILQELFPFGYFRCSRRGQNGYLKIRYDTIRQFNQMAGRLEQSLQRYFLTLSILCDFETKGTITADKSGSLAKMPFGGAMYPCYMKDETDYWHEGQLEKFKACPVVNVRRVEQIAQQLVIDDEKAKAFAQHKKELDEKAHPEREIVAFILNAMGNGRKLAVMDMLINPYLSTFQQHHQRLPTPEEAVAWLKGSGKYKGAEEKPVEKPVEKAVVISQPKPSVRPCSVRVKTELPPSESADAFRRNLDDLPPFVRAFYSAHRRFPTTDEALQWLKDNGRYSGEWEDGFNRRARRVGQILRFFERDFDPEMLGSGGKPSVSLGLGRFSWWVQQKFGLTMTAKVRDTSRPEIMTTGNDGPFDAVTVKAPTTTVSIPAKFVETFLAVAEFCCRTDPLDNKAVPTNRIKEIWGMVKDGAAWNQKYFQVVRNRLHRMGVISIFDRHHHVGKAWRWTVGKNMPSDSWREDQRRFKEEHRLPAALAKSLEEIIAVDITNDNNNNMHNTLYYDESQVSAICLPDEQVRPPPWPNSLPSRQFDR
jgi:hypothetical protein